MSPYRPITQSLKERIELLLIESMNRVEPEHIDLYVIQTTNKLMEMFYDEVNYGQTFSRTKRS